MPTSGRGASARRDPSIAFFEDLASRGNDPRLHDAKGTLRIDIEDGGTTEQVFVTMDRGTVKIAHRGRKVDAALSVDKRMFTRIVEGKANALTALLRGALRFEGDLGIVTSFERLFPGPPDAKGPSITARKGKTS